MGAGEHDGLQVLKFAYTLDFRIVVLALIIVLAGNFPKSNNRPVPNKRTGATLS